MGILTLEVAPEFAARSAEDLQVMLSEETAKIAGIKQEMGTISGEISEAVNSDETEKALALKHRRDDLPVHARATEVRRSQIEMALNDILLREGEPPLAELAREMEKEDKALTRAQERRDRAHYAWADMNGGRENRQNRQRELAMRIRDLRTEQIQILHNHRAGA